MDVVKRAKEVFQLEIEELSKLSNSIGEEISEAVERIYSSEGKLVIMGIGKTGIIGHKIASSLASTGTQAVFVNAAEAIHGDLGLVSKNDIVLLISNSGCSSEVLNLIRPLRALDCFLMAMTGNLNSPLAKEVDLVLNVGVEKEACSLGLAPTSSTTATLVMGDALTICLMERRNFKAENFAVYHPGGALGRQLLARVKNAMELNLPKVYKHTPFKDVVYEVGNKRLGMTLVYDEREQAVGIITDGDIRRAVQHFDDIKRLKAADFMTSGFKSVSKDKMLTEALELMDKSNITTLAVTESDLNPEIVGIVSIHHIIDFQN